MSARTPPSRLLACALALALVACGDRGAPAPPSSGGAAAASADTSPASAPRGTTLRAPSNAGSFVAEVTPLGGEVPTNVAFAVELALFRADGTTPYEPESVTLDARMEEHEHGMLRDVALERSGPGRWRAAGLLFHMVGVWQFQIDVREGPRIERAQMDLTLQ
ncbi:MAG: hypothetical protein R3F49_02480 [Planctomycetota bacterium]